MTDALVLFSTQINNACTVYWNNHSLLCDKCCQKPYFGEVAPPANVNSRNLIDHDAAGLLVTCRWQHCALCKLIKILLEYRCQRHHRFIYGWYKWNNPYLSFCYLRCRILTCLDMRMKEISSMVFMFASVWCTFCHIVYLYLIDCQKHRCSFCDSYRRREKRCM